MAARKTKDDLINARICRDQKRILFDIARKRGVSLSSLLRSIAEEATERLVA